ncbi:hypothetical protein K439DRAFT_1644792 [Ramaria rubella]|nr:hypothetical protein K439DRAFT_1644792 [Ramaria rubella]
MANAIRSAKSGSSWTKADLIAYNIDVVKKGEEEFFGSRANSPLDHVNRSFLEFDYGQRIPRNADKIIPYLDLASRSKEGQESMVDDFAKELLRSLGFESEGRLIRTRHILRMVISGQDSTAQTDVCIIDMSNTLLLLVQEDKRDENPKDPEPQVIAEAIAAFQENNKIRVDYDVDELDRMIIPCITMIGTFPIFYLVTVTRELSECVMTAQYPSSKTIVLKHVPNVRRKSDGMKPVGSRRKDITVL